MSICGAALLLFASGAVAAHAQVSKADIRVTSLSPTPRVRVEGERASASNIWSFRNVYASVIGIGERIENLTLKDDRGVEIPVRKIAPGEWKAEGAARHFSYEVSLEAPTLATDAAFVSWLTAQQGFLMLGDLLPQATEENAKSASVSFSVTLPAGWSASTTESKATDGRYEIRDAERAVFFVGERLRERHERVGPTDFIFVTTGEWAFTDEESAHMAVSILKEHADMIGGGVRGRAMLALSPFPRAVDAGRWSAETRGRTVTLLSGRSPSRTAALAQLSVPLTHELFHLWIPNALRLDGDYSWFYEGFTMYAAMRAALRLNLLTFQDSLQAIGRAFDAYSSASVGAQLSLLASSQRRWTGPASLVYNKGMVVAFLYDLTLRSKTKGKRSIEDAYRELLRRYQEAQSDSDGNAAALNALNNPADMREFTRQYIERADAIDLRKALAPFGLRAETVGSRTRVFVAERLSREQRDLLRKIGYNL